MAKVAARRMGNIKNLQKSLEKSSAGQWIHSLKGDTTEEVRFLTEPEEWIGYNEYWDQDARTFVPVGEGEEVPSNASYRYLAAVVLVDQDTAVAFKMSKGLAQRVFLRYQRNGTILDRNYYLIRTGTGLQDTEYDVDSESASKFPFKKYEVPDLIDILERAYDQGHDDDEEEPARPRKRRSGLPVSKGDDSFMEEDDDDDEEETQPKKRARRGRSRGGVVAPVEEEDELEELEDEEEEDEPEEPEEDEPTEEDPYTVEELAEMKISELREIADDLGIDTTGMRKRALIEAIIEEQDF